jgi:hypothetical protein
MSAKAVGWVYDHSPYTGAKFAVHLAIADSANDIYGYEFWMAFTKLARKSRLTRQAVQQAVHQMTEDGALKLVWQSNGGRSRPSRYELVMSTDFPQVWEATAPEGDPALLPIEIAVSQGTANVGAQTANHSTQTANPVSRHLTQEEPNEPRGVSLVCRECTTTGFASADELADHQEQNCTALHVGDGDFQTAREALRKAGGRG